VEEEEEAHRKHIDFDAQRGLKLHDIFLDWGRFWGASGFWCGGLFCL